MSWEEEILKKEIMPVELRIFKEDLPRMIMKLDRINQDWRNRKSFNTQAQRDYIGLNAYVIKNQLEKVLKYLEGV